MKTAMTLRLITIITMIALGGCATVATLPFPSGIFDQGPARTPVELQAIQTREFEADKRQVMSALIAVFQDEGYRINQTDFDIGVVSATTPEEKQFAELVGSFLDKEMKAQITESAPSFGKIIFPFTSQRTINAVVSEISPLRSKLRITMIVEAKTLSPAVAPYSGTDTNPERYQSIFAKIQQGLFLKKNLE